MGSRRSAGSAVGELGSVFKRASNDDSRKTQVLPRVRIYVAALDGREGLLPTYMVYLTDRGGVYGYTADEPPVVGQVVKLDHCVIRAKVESIEVGEQSKIYTAVKTE